MEAIVFYTLMVLALSGMAALVGVLLVGIINVFIHVIKEDLKR